MTRHQANGLAPPLVSQDINGRSFKLEASRQEKPQLLYFFAEWCPICKIQHSVISSINQDYRVTGIAMQSGDIENVKKYIASQNIDFRVISDESGEISRSFRVNGVPATFIIDKAGQIKFSTQGYATEAGLRSRIWLAEKSKYYGQPEK